MSPIVIPRGCVLVVKSTFGAKEIVPETQVFLYIDTELELWFATAISTLPSPSISPDDRTYGTVPVVKSTFGAKEIIPNAPLFLNIDIEVEAPLAVAISVLPSPSKSFDIILLGPLFDAKSTLGEKLILVIEGKKFEIQDAVFRSLNPFEKPKEIHFVSQFLETETGKINRNKTIRYFSILK